MDSTTHRPPTDAAIAAVEEQMVVLFSRIRASWKEGAASVHPELQPAGFKILASLARGGPHHAGALAEQLFTDKSVMSRQVRCMEGLGLVESHADPTDGRARVIAATPEATACIDLIRTSNQEKLHERLREWPDEDIAQFADLLGRIAF